MTFIWPNMLWLLLAVPALIALYVFLVRRKRKAAMRYASLGMVRDAMGAGPGFRRHVPPLLFLLALVALILAVARPAAIVTLPSQEQTIILALDVSGSMRAADVEPHRLAAAQAAAKAFIADQPRHVRVGVVSFAGTASLVQPPTDNREHIVAAIDRLHLQPGTAIGSGIIVSLAALFPDAGIDVSALLNERDVLPRSRRSAALPAGPTNSQETQQPEFTPVPPGSNDSAAIILLTDGQRTTGPDSVEAARMAADRGVRVFTVGIGTTAGETLAFEGWSMHVRLDEETLKAIADLTRAEYFYAGTAEHLKRIYQSLNTRLVMKTEETEISALFAAMGAVLALLSGLLSLLWFNRVL